jgi:glycosyltransferase involved in cell wall biosynthesis
MHIGIDGGCWNNRRGYGRFFRELLTALAKNDGRNRYTIFLDRSSYESFPGQEQFRPRLVETSRSVSDAATADSRRSLTDLFRMGWAVSQEDLDLFFFPSVYSYFPLLRPVPAIIGIHDTIADRNPHFAFQSKRQELAWRCKVRLALVQARTVLTVSEYSKRCVQQWLKVPANRIRVVYEAASPRFHRDANSPPGPPYILYVGGISPNKNLSTLIRAFAHLEARARGTSLILVGDYESDGFKTCYSELKTLVGDLMLEDQIRFTGFIPDEELCRLYNGASLFVLPSFDEGFGLPAIEAMACGLATIVSTGNALEEVVGDTGISVDPHDEAALAGEMDRLLRNPQLRQNLGEKAARRAAEFSWDSTALQLLRVFEDARGGNHGA